MTLEMDTTSEDHSPSLSENAGSTWLNWEAEISSISCLNISDSQPELSTLVEDKEVAARAVAFVVNSTRKGIVPLCADIANLLRAKRSLEKKVYLLKREIEALRSSTSASFRTSHSTSATPPLLEKILVSEQAGGLSSRPCSRSSQCSSTMSNSPRLESTHNFKSYLSSPSVSGDGLRRTSPRLPRQHPKFVVNGSCNVSAAPSNTFSDEASHKNETTTLAKRADGSRKNSLPEMTSEPSLEVKRVSPKANKETQCCITLAGDSPREEQFIETVRLNSKLAEELGSAKKEIEVLKGRLKELEMIQLARECTKQHYQECQGLPGEAIYPGTRDDCSLTAPESSNKAATYRPQASKNHRLSPLSKPRSIKTTARSSYVCAEPLYGCKCSACEAAMGGDLHAALNDSLKVDLHKFPISSGALVQLGDHVVIKGEKTGRIRYIGHLDRIGEPNLVFVGLELDAPAGSHDGFFNKKRYFFCQKDHGIFIPLYDIICKVTPQSFLEPKLDNTWPSSSTDAVLASLGVRGLTNVQGKTRSVDNLKSKSTEDFIALVGMTSRPHGKSNWLKSEMLTRRDDPLCRMTASAFGEDSV